MVVRRLIAETDVAERVLHDRLEDVGRLHSDLLREAAVARAWLARSRLLLLHVKLVHDDLEDVELFRAQVAQQRLVRAVRRIQILVGLVRARHSAVFLGDLLEEAVAAVVQLDQLFRLKLLQVVLIVGLLVRVVALIHHV